MENLGVIKKTEQPTDSVHSQAIAKKKNNKISDLSHAVRCEHFPTKTGGSYRQNYAQIQKNVLNSLFCERFHDYLYGQKYSDR